MFDEIMESPFSIHHLNRMIALEELVEFVDDGTIEADAVTDLWKKELAAWQAKYEKYGKV